MKSRLQFPRMRELFFANEPWQLVGDGDFDGTFHLFKGGHDLTGRFTSELAGVDDYRFPALFGGAALDRTGFEVTDAGSQLYGGDARFGFSIAPLGSPTPSTARFDATLRGRRSRADHRFLPAARPAVRRPRDRPESAGLAARTFSRAPRRRRGDRRAAAGRRDDDALARGGASRRPGSAGPGVGTVAPPRRSPGTCRSAARSPISFDPDAVEASNGRFATERTHVVVRRRRPPGAASRSSSSTSPAPTGRRATRCSPAC